MAFKPVGLCGLQFLLLLLLLNLDRDGEIDTIINRARSRSNTNGASMGDLKRFLSGGCWEFDCAGKLFNGHCFVLFATVWRIDLRFKIRMLAKYRLAIWNLTDLIYQHNCPPIVEEPRVSAFAHLLPRLKSFCKLLIQKSVIRIRC